MDGKVWRLLPAQTFTMNTWDVEAAHIFLADGASIVTPAGHEAAAGFTLTQIPNQFPPLQDCTFRAQMVDQLTFDESPWQLPFTNQDGRPSVSLGNFFPKHHPGGHNFRIVIEKTEGVLYGDGTFTAGGLNLTSFSPSACGKDISRP
jgi:hypothetical protein